MTKNLYPAPGQLVLYCRVSSMVGRRVLVTNDKGTNSMFNVAREYKEKVANAKLNSIYKHMKKGGSSDAQVEIIDYDIIYYDKKFNVVRKLEKEKRGKTTVTYATAYNRKTGKRLGKRILRKGDTLE